MPDPQEQKWEITVCLECGAVVKEWHDGHCPPSMDGKHGPLQDRIVVPASLLSESQAEVDRLRAENEAVMIANELQVERIAELQSELAESQARERQLRDLLRELADKDCFGGTCICDWQEKARECLLLTETKG